MYGDVVEEIREQMKTYYPDVNVDFICTTNGVWENRERIKNFLEKYSFKKILSVSIDFIGRYKSDKIKQIAYDTMTCNKYYILHVQTIAPNTALTHKL